MNRRLVLRLELHLYGGSQVPTFVQRPGAPRRHHTTLLSRDVTPHCSVVWFWCDCGVCVVCRVRNDEVLQRTGLTSLSHLQSRRCISVFGHVARLDGVTPANVALQLHINVSLNRPPDRTWRRPPGRPRNKWLDQLRNDSTRPTGGLWRRAVDRGHGGATTRRPSLATRT